MKTLKIFFFVAIITIGALFIYLGRNYPLLFVAGLVTGIWGMIKLFDLNYLCKLKERRSNGLA